MIVALATPRVAASVEECLDKIKQSLSEAAARGAEIVCFPEAYLPGLRGLDFEVPPFDRTQQERALGAVDDWARSYRVAVVLGTEWHTDAGRHIAAAVVDVTGEVRGVQTKNQLAPTEDPLYVP